MSGLANPRGLAFGPGGSLYVAEAGEGGTGHCMVVRGQTQCVGATGAVSRLRRGMQEQVATGLPSYAPQAQPNEEGATGPHDISFQGGTGWITIGLGGDPAVIRSGFGNGFGRLVRMRQNGGWSLSTDISAHEVANNPDRGPIDSNPYGVLARRGAKYVAEAGGNALLRVAANGAISTAAVFPSRSYPAPGARDTDSVPTDVVFGPGGALYVSELTGGPFADGAANVWRVRETAPPEVYRSGFKTLIDLEFGCNGDLYVLQYASGPFGLAPPGRLIRVDPDGNRSEVPVALAQPGGLAADCVRGDDGDGRTSREVIYVSNRSTSPDAGEVLRIEP
jgi:hypothetical protein